MKNYLKNQKITKRLLHELESRKKGYLYLFIEKKNKDYIFTDKNVIKDIHDHFCKIDHRGIVTVKGKVIYPGCLMGKS